MPGIVHYWGPYPYRSAFHAQDEQEEGERALQHLRDLVMVEGPQHHRGDHPRDRWSAPTASSCRRRATSRASATCATSSASCMIADEVMAGFARCGEWFAVDHWGVAPDLITFAKGVNSGYVPLGGVIISERIAQTFDQRPFPGGLTYSGHPLACASAVASIEIFKEEGIVEHARALGEDVIGPGLRELAERHPSVGEVRGLGAFWALELVRDRRDPRAAGAVQRRPAPTPSR